MARAKAGKKLNSAPTAREKVTVKAFTRSPNGQGRQVVALRVSLEELEALDALADKWQVTFSEAIRETLREKLAEEKLLVS